MTASAVVLIASMIVTAQIVLSSYSLADELTFFAMLARLSFFRY